MYKLLTEIPVPSSAHFIDSNGTCFSISQRASVHDRKLATTIRELLIHLTSTWHDHIRNTKRTASNSLVISDSSVAVSSLQDVGDQVAFTFSSSGNSRAVLREVKNETKPKRFVEVWKNGLIAATIEVTDRHGAFYTDEHLASLTFSTSEKLLLYVAESNPPTATENDPYAKFRYTPQFGEGIANKRRPTIFVFSWNNDSSAPSQSLVSLSIPSQVLFGQAIFALQGNTLYATGYEYTSDHRLLGIKSCFNRPTGIWEITPSTSLSVDDIDPKEDITSIECNARKLTPSNMSCRSPRIFVHNKTTTLVWLSHPTGGAHAATSTIHSLNITSEPDLVSLKSPLVDTVFKPVKGSFPGLYPEPNFAKFPTLHLSESTTPSLVTHSAWGSRTTVLLISTKDGGVKDLTPEDGNLYSWKVLNTDGKSRVICTRSTPVTPNELVLGKFNANGEVSWRVVHKPTLSQILKEELSHLRASIIPIPDRYPTETIVIQSVFTPDNKRDIRPCITSPHGGPHGTTTTAFSPATVALALEQYTISLPNYTGSLGYGEDAVRALLGKCGTLDVEDCIASVRHLIKLGISVEGPGKQFVLGGSHGGFLSGHLIGQYPNMFSAAAMRNPVISAGEISTTDIPDWYYAEFGLEYPIFSTPSAAEPPVQSRAAPPVMSPEIFERVHRMSPIAHVDAVRASVLLLIGASDLRVAPTQGIEYYHALRQRQKENARVEMLVFDGESHPLEGVEAARVGWEASRDFFKWAETLVVQFPITK